MFTYTSYFHHLTHAFYFILQKKKLFPGYLYDHDSINTQTKQYLFKLVGLFIGYFVKRYILHKFRKVS